MAYSPHEIHRCSQEMQVIEGYLPPKTPAIAHSPMRGKTLWLHGLGGMSKTQLAVVFARKHGEEFSAVL